MIVTSEAPGCTVVAVTGELDIYTAPALSEAIGGLVQAGVDDVVLDLTGVEFLDSTGLGVLVSALKKIRANDGSLQLVFTQNRLFKVFSITGLTSVFVIRDSVDAAVAAVGMDAGPRRESDDDSDSAEPLVAADQSQDGTLSGI